MRLLLVLLLASLLGSAACKSTSKDDSDTAAWLNDGNRKAAMEFVRTTVVEYYTDVKPDHAVLTKFAAAIVEQGTQQTESAEYLLKAHFDFIRNGGEAGESSPLQQYILGQFVTLTNYIAYHHDSAATPLSMLTVNSR